MAGFSIAVDVQDMETAVEFLGSLSGRQLRDLATMAGVELVKISRAAFNDRSDPVDGSKWVVSGRRRSGGATLRDTSRLMRSVKARVEGRGDVLVGSHLEYARIHQLGGQAGPRDRRVTIPRRRYLGHEKAWPRRFLGVSEVRRLFGR